MLSRRALIALTGLVSFYGIDFVMSELSEDADGSQAALAQGNDLVPLIYSKHYDVTAFGLEKLHPFDGRKYSKVMRSIVQSGLRAEGDFISPDEIIKEQLLLIHTPEYLKSLKHSFQLAKILEQAPLAPIPHQFLDWRILKPMRIASGGTILTCRWAMKKGLAINVGGGYHHAERNSGGGFCVYCDIPISLEILRREGLIKTAMVVDTDAHQGNGFSNVLGESDSNFYLDFFDESIYPYPKVEEDWSVAFPARTTGDKYLSTLEDVLPKALDKFRPDLIVYNAGSDVLKSDPLSTFQLSIEEMNQRDLFVVSTARAQDIPLAMVMAGGYSHESGAAHSRSITGILAKFDKRT